jgi:hypothetical protein
MYEQKPSAPNYALRRAIAATVLAVGIGSAEAASPSTEVSDSPASWVAGPINKVGEKIVHGGATSQTEQIIESPSNIPEGHKITITVDHTGDGPIKVSQHIGAEGHVEDLAAELSNERVDGILPAGEYPVYKQFVDKQYWPDQEAKH